jgi:hypothetical protein
MPSQSDPTNIHEFDIIYTATGTTPGDLTVTCTVQGHQASPVPPAAGMSVFDATVYDATPQIQSVTPNVIAAGQDTPVTIAGNSFGTAMGTVRVCDWTNWPSAFLAGSGPCTQSGAWTVAGINLWGAMIEAILHAATTASGHYCLQVTSLGANGRQFLPAPNSESSATSSCIEVKETPTITLREVSWDGRFAIWKQNPDWRQDKLKDEGSTQVANPVWIDSDGDGTPETSDPVAYLGSQILRMANVTLAANPSITADAQVRVVTDQSLLTFPVASVHFDGSSGAVIPTLISDHAFAGVISNMNVKLTWSISFDGWQTSTVFATSFQRVFVTLAAPAGFAGGLGFPAKPHVTAARLNRVTTDLQGIGSAASATSTTSSNVAKIDFGNNVFGSGSLADIGSDPWAVLDNPGLVTSSGLDCISLSVITLVQLQQAGVAASLSRAFPTTDLDATMSELSVISGRDVTLDFLLSDGATHNEFEAYLFLYEGGYATNAYTVAPLRGPLDPVPSALDAFDPLQPVEPAHLAFSVIGRTLQGTQALQTPQNPNAGRQWWISIDFGTAVQGPVPFPAGYGVQ